MDKLKIVTELKKYFKVQELVDKLTYQRWGESAWNFLDGRLLEVILILRRDILKVPLVCNDWLYGGKNEQRGLRTNLSPLVKQKTDRGVLYLSQHCFDDKTLILTDRGWLGINDILEKDKVFSYNIENEVIELKPIDSIIKQEYQGKMVKIKNMNADILVTDEHRMIVRCNNKKYKRKTNKPLTEKGKSYFDSLKTNNDIWHIELAKDVVGKRRELLCAANVQKYKECDLKIWKLAFATIADGFFKYKNGSVSIGFRFKKQRKCEQLEELLNEIGSPITKTLDKNNVWNYYIRNEYAEKIHAIIGENKDIPVDVLLFGGNILKELVYYYAQYDGCFSKRNGDKHFSISSSNKNNADILQTMCALSGMRSQINTIEPHIYNIKGKIGYAKQSYNITVNPQINKTRINEDKTSVIDYKGNVWCVNNSNTTLITKRNGLISIQGNCLGKAVDLVSSKMTAEEMRKLIVKNAAKLPCKVRIEADVNWLHVDVMDDITKKDKVYLFKA